MTNEAKPQHEQDYETVFGWVQALHVESGTRKVVDPALSRLHAEAAKVPGLEAWREAMLSALATGLDYTPTAAEAPNRLRGIITDATAAEQRAVDAESERDAARLDMNRLVVEHRAEMREMMEKVGESTRLAEAMMAERNDYAGDVTALRERVATLEAERVTAGETESDLRRAVEHLQCTLEGVAEGTTGWEWNLVTVGVARAESAEARARELADALGEAATTLEEHGAAMLSASPTEFTVKAQRDVIERAHAIALRAYKSQPTSAPAQGVDEDVATVHGALDLLEHDDVGQRTEGFSALGRLASRLSTPTQPALVDAVGYALESLTSAGSHPNVVARLRAAYDAAKGGATPAVHPLGCTCDECARDAAIYANRGNR